MLEKTEISVPDIWDGPFIWVLHVKHTLKNFGFLKFFVIRLFSHHGWRRKYCQEISRALLSIIFHLLLQTLYTYPDNFRAQKVLIAAEYSGAKVKTCPNFVFGETNTTKEFLAKFPSGKVT